MDDPLMPHIAWIGPLLEQPFPEEFAPGSTEHNILCSLKEGWGTIETAQLLTGLTDRYGEQARETVGRFIEVTVHQGWAETGRREARPGSEIDDFIHLLWDPLPSLGFEFTIAGDPTDRRFSVTRCPVYEAAAAAGMEEWMFPLSCGTDPFSATGFCSRIEFTRTETLMQGGTRCDHRYRYRE